MKSILYLNECCETAYFCDLVGWNVMDGFDVFWMTFLCCAITTILMHCLFFFQESIKMIITKQNRRIIYENLFKGIYPSHLLLFPFFAYRYLFYLIEGVLVAKKDFNAPKHEELDVPNLQVIKALQSLTSSGYVKTQFSWQWYYYVLTPEGVEYLREWYEHSKFYLSSH